MKTHNYIEILKGSISDKTHNLTCALVGCREAAKKDGSPYLLLIFQDISSSINIPVWEDYEKFEKLQFPKVVEIEVFVSEWKGRKTFRLKAIKNSNVEIKEFFPVVDTQKYWDLIQSKIDILPLYYKLLLEKLFDLDLQGQTLKERFLVAPAALSHHQNYTGGLVFHTSNVVGWVDKFSQEYIEQGLFKIDRDLLIAAAIIHDISKTVEYTGERDLQTNFYTWSFCEGSLPHPLTTVAWVESLWFESGLTLQQKTNLQSLILSHHGSYGKYPVDSVEASMLHLADAIDACVHDPKAKFLRGEK